MVMYNRKKKAEYVRARCPPLPSFRTTLTPMERNQAATMKAQGIDPATTAPPPPPQQQQQIDVIVPVSAATTTTSTTTSSSIPAGSDNVVRGPWEKFKGWAFSGMTPADKEYKTAFERVRDAERREAEMVVAPIVAAATRDGRDGGNRIDRLGADDLVKGEKPKGGSVGVLSSVTGWWSGR
jgi:hypothetical protein